MIEGGIPNAHVRLSMPRMWEKIIDRGDIERTRTRRCAMSGMSQQEAAATFQPVYCSHDKEELAAG